MSEFESIDEDYEAWEDDFGESDFGESDFEAATRNRQAKRRPPVRRAPKRGNPAVGVQGRQYGVVRTPQGDARVELPGKFPTVDEFKQTITKLQQDIAANSAGIGQLTSRLQGDSQLEYAELRGEAPPTLGRDFVDALGRLRLPGNVRELENLVFAAMSALDHEGPLTLRELPRSALEELAAPEHGTRGERQRASSPPPMPTPTENWNLSEAVDACERTLVAAALAECKGNQAAAAKLLGVTPRTVFNKLHRHGLGTRSRSTFSPPPPTTEADLTPG